MHTRQTILYIGTIDEHYRRLCDRTSEDGYTIVQLSDYTSALKMIDGLDVFIIIRADNPHQDNRSEIVQALSEFCRNHNIALVEIQNEIISVSQLFWQRMSLNLHNGQRY